MKKAIIFDLNGVMVVGPLLSEQFRGKGVPPEKFLPALQETMAKVRIPEAESVYSYWKKYFDSWNIAMTEEEFHALWFGAERENVEMTSLARELKAKGLRLFILSNNLRERSAYYDKQFPFFKELFEKQYYSWQTGFVKPDSRAYRLILEENALAPEEVVYFDDSAKNVTAAQALGIESHIFENADMVRAILKIEAK